MVYSLLNIFFVSFSSLDGENYLWIQRFLLMKRFRSVLVEIFSFPPWLRQEQRSRWELERKMKSFSTSSSGGGEVGGGEGVMMARVTSPHWSTQIVIRQTLQSIQRGVETVFLAAIQIFYNQIYFFLKSTFWKDPSINLKSYVDFLFHVKIWT